jgi:hypothetical protein
LTKCEVLVTERPRAQLQLLYRRGLLTADAHRLFDRGVVARLTAKRLERRSPLHCVRMLPENRPVTERRHGRKRKKERS